MTKNDLVKRLKETRNVYFVEAAKQISNIDDDLFSDNNSFRYIVYLAKLAIEDKLISPEGFLHELERRGFASISNKDLRKGMNSELIFVQSSLLQSAMQDGTPLDVFARLAYRRAQRLPVYGRYYLKFIKDPRASIYKKGLMTSTMKLWLMEFADQTGQKDLKEAILYK